MEDLTKLSKTELIDKLTNTEERLNNYLNEAGGDSAAKELEAFKKEREELQNTYVDVKVELDTLKKEHSKLALRYGKKAFELIITEWQLEAIKSRNLWDRIWNR